MRHYDSCTLTPSTCVSGCWCRRAAGAAVVVVAAAAAVVGHVDGTQECGFVDGVQDASRGLPHQRHGSQLAGQHQKPQRRCPISPRRQRQGCAVRKRGHPCVVVAPYDVARRAGVRQPQFAAAGKKLFCGLREATLRLRLAARRPRRFAFAQQQHERRQRRRGVERSQCNFSANHAKHGGKSPKRVTDDRRPPDLNLVTPFQATAHPSAFLWKPSAVQSHRSIHGHCAERLHDSLSCAPIPLTPPQTSARDPWRTGLWTVPRKRKATQREDLAHSKGQQH